MVSARLIDWSHDGWPDGAEGRISLDGFSVRRYNRHPASRSIYPVLVGRVSSHPSGSRVRITIRPNFLDLAFNAYFMLMGGAFAMVIVNGMAESSPGLIVALMVCTFMPLIVTLRTYAQHAPVLREFVREAFALHV